MKLVTPLAFLLAGGDAAAICEPFCTEPCSALSGDTAYECGACEGSHYRCKGRRTSKQARQPPVATQLKPQVQARTPFSPAAITEALGRTASEHCNELAQRGMCDTKLTDREVRAVMLKFCAAACLRREVVISNDDLQHHRQWARLSLFDYRRFDATQCARRSRILAALRPHTRCADLEDFSRLRDRGWAIRRNFVPPRELKRMAERVADIKEPSRSMCGASGYQPAPCFLSAIDGGWEGKFPHFFRKLTDMLQGWISSGFNEEAHLGWPLHVRGGEFVKISPWRRPQPATCLFRALFIHSASQPDRKRDQCLASDCKRLVDPELESQYPELDPKVMCRFRCEWLAVTRLSRQEIKQVVKHPDCNAPMGRSLSWLKRFTFAESPDAEPQQWTEGTMPSPDITEMHGWLRLTLNDSSVFSGYHGYHQDGPHEIGRFHKVFVMVEKNRTTERREDTSATLTNLMAVNAQTRYMVNCELEDEDWAMEKFECRPRLYPGDILFFREDVWHSTQDTALDRISLILDVWRMPLRTTPTSFIEKGSKAAVSERQNEASGYIKNLFHKDDQTIFS